MARRSTGWSTSATSNTAAEVRASGETEADTNIEREPMKAETLDYAHERDGAESGGIACPLRMGCRLKVQNSVFRRCPRHVCFSLP